MKKYTILGIFSATLVILALLVGPGMNFALAKSGSGSGNSERRDNSGPGSINSGRSINNDDDEDEDEDDEDEDNDNNNNGNAALRTRILALETLVQQQEARILALERRIGNGNGDVTAPVISATAAANIATTSADITWTTNEPAKSRVFYSTSSPVNLATAKRVANQSLVLNHSLHLSGLVANTTYFFVVESVDASKNISKSAEFSFKTLALADVTAPVVSAVSAANITATSANINWTTNESASSKVYFSTTSPVNLATAPSVTNSTLVLSHTTPLTGLTANTTYFFVVESKDEANNTTTSPQQSFVTAL